MTNAARTPIWITLALVSACAPGAGVDVGDTPDALREIGEVEQKLEPSTSTGSFIKYGQSLDVVGDLDGDGSSEVVVGAPENEDGSSNFTGAAYLYFGTVSGVDASSEVQLEPDSDEGFEKTRFGAAVHGPGDLDGDGYDDLLIGANWAGGDGSSTYGEGAVFAYFGSASGISTSSDQVVTSTDGEAEGQFGSNITSGDYDNDGVTDIVVSQTGTVSGDGEGSVYAYYGVTTAIDTATEQKISPSALTAGTTFGGLLASADIDADGYEDLLVSGGESVFVYYGSATGLSTASEEIVTASGNKRVDGLAAADFDGDGYADMGVSERLVEDGSGNRMGAAYVLYGSASGVDGSSEETIDNPTGIPKIGFGNALAAADLDSDGYSELVIAAPDVDLSFQNAVGSLYVHHGSASGLSGTADEELFPSDWASLTEPRLGTWMATGDIDGDGADDLAAGAKRISAAYLYLSPCPDADEDLVCDDDEDINGNDDFDDDDSDGDGTPDYLDDDDDDDSIPTWAEDVDGDGDPMNDDSDSDGTPDYLDSDAENQPAVADAGEDSSSTLGNDVTLDGSGCVDFEGDAFTTRWKLVAVPTSSTLRSRDIDDRNAAVTTFTPDVAGIYVASIKVDDGTSIDRDEVTITVTAGSNLAPTADASATATSVDLGSAIALDASNSSDPDGDTLTFRWKLLAKPGASTLNSNSIDDRDAETTAFTPDVTGTYRFQVKVSDGIYTTSDVADVEAFEFTTLTADAGSNSSETLGNSFTLDGSGTSGSPDSYRWKLLTSPSGSALGSGAIDNRDIASTTFTPDVAGKYIFQLTVTRVDETSTDTVKHTAVAAASLTRPRVLGDAVGRRVDDDGIGTLDSGLVDVRATFAPDKRRRLDGEDGSAFVGIATDVDGDGDEDALVYAVTDEVTVPTRIFLSTSLREVDWSNPDHDAIAVVEQADAERLELLFLGVHPGDLWLFDGLE